MSFAWPHFFWGLALPLLLIAWDLRRARAKAAAGAQPNIRRAEVGPNELRLVTDGGRQTADDGQPKTNGPSRAAGRLLATPKRSGEGGSTVRRIRLWFALGLTLLMVALARPQWGRIDEPVFDQSREIILALDLSRSMLTPDVKPSRLERAKLLVQALLEKLEGERVGLIVFSGTAFLQSPLSADYEILREFLPALSPEFLPEGGTNYEALLSTASDAFGASTSADRFLIVLSDGEATDDDWRGQLETLKKKGVRVIGLGLGTTAGAMIPDGSGGFVKDDRGAVVMSKLEPRTLQELAKGTNGTYRDASTWLDLATLVSQTVETGRKGDFVDTKSVRLVERFQWPLAFAVWCLLVSLYREFPVRPRPRAIALTPSAPVPPASAGTASLLLALLLTAASLSLVSVPSASAADAGSAGVPPASPSGTAGGPPASPAPDTPNSKPETGNEKPETQSPLGRIVSRLSAQDTLSAPDLAEFARETLRWGTRIKEQQQKVPPGPVHDALQAVDELMRRDDRLTDWSKLRDELKALLEEQKQEPPPEQQPQDQQQQQQSKDQKQQDQNQNKQDQKKSDPSQQDPSKSDSQNQPPQDQSADQNPASPPQKSDQKSDPREAFGDMKKSEPPPPPRGDTQKVGGTPQKKQAPPNANPELALPMEKVEQLKNQDSPAELFKAMQADGKQPQPKTGKNW